MVTRLLPSGTMATTDKRGGSEMNLLGTYQNGNYTVKIYSDGTKIRKNDLDFFKPEFPESMDIKITNQCDKLCKFCHEASVPDGRHGDVMNLPFLETLHPYTELAIGGGNPLSHPDLIPFLEGLKERKLIPSMTANQTHFLENIPLLSMLSERELLYGLGVSFISGTPQDELNRMIGALEKFPNAVIHVINGIVSVEELRALAFHDFKVLILGYKKFRRGAHNWAEDEEEIVSRQRNLYDELPAIIQSGWFHTVSFDNLAVNQLGVRRLMDSASWERFYMGDDGNYTMYVDAVNREYAVCSVSQVRYPLTDNIKEMFDTVLKEPERYRADK